ncbi:MAG: hypothetical protein B7C24_01660 [Bacteroidetes bacterium 4572_77]|nr:MAG: hypothetical protein B7C24_01660 [Bacteroidetes bacterium 4572_77]
MKKTYVLLALLTFALANFAQTVKVHKSSLKLDGTNIIADEMGFAELTIEAHNSLIEGKTITPYQNTYYKDSKSIELFPGFPVDFSSSPKENAVYCNMDEDPELEIIYIGFSNVFAYNIDGTLVSGFPSETFTNLAETPPSLGDITGDGIPEIVFATRYQGSSLIGSVYAYDLEGKILPNFPINHGYNGGAPSLFDVDNDGKLEILISKRINGSTNAELYIYNEDGTVVENWPQAFPHYIPTGSISVADIDNDQQAEIVAAYYKGIVAFELDGTQIFDFPLPENVSISYSSPVIANLDETPEKEIIFGTWGFSGAEAKVYVLDYQGNSYPNWPIEVQWNIAAHVSIADIDQNGTLDIFAVDQVGGSATFYLYGWDKDGNQLSGFPIAKDFAGFSQILIADIDNDQQLELITDDNRTYAGSYAGLYHSFNHDGSEITNDWPLELSSGGTFYKTPTILDVDQDGNLDFLGAGGTIAPYTTSAYLWKLNIPVPANHLLPLTTAMYNLQRTGEYIPPSTQETFSVTFNIMDELEPEITLSGYGTQTATGGTSVFYDVNETPDPGILYTIELAGFETINDYVIVDEDEIVVIDMISTSIFETQNKPISIYPNPSNGSFTIKNLTDIQNLISIDITDITGKRIQSNQYSLLKEQCIIEKSGIYFIKIQTENQIFSEKIIIQ